MHILQKIDNAFLQLVDLQIFAAPRVALKPLVPTFPCFANIIVSLMERVSSIFFFCQLKRFSFDCLIKSKWLKVLYMVISHSFTATCRFRTKNYGRGCDVHTWPLQICSGAALVILIIWVGWGYVYIVWKWIITNYFTLRFKLFANYPKHLQEMIRKQVASLYLWPQSLDIPVLDAST